MARPIVELPNADPAAAGQSAEGLLRRLLHSGRLRGFPKHPEQRDAVLAIAAGRPVRRWPYAEPEINEALVEWLASVRADIDHVTLRRRMVDCGFLKRRPDGSVYFLNYGRVADVLGDPAIEVDAGAISDDILRDREARKRSHA